MTCAVVIMCMAVLLLKKSLATFQSAGHITSPVVPLSTTFFQINSQLGECFYNSFADSHATHVFNFYKSKQLFCTKFVIYDAGDPEISPSCETSTPMPLRPTIDRQTQKLCARIVAIARDQPESFHCLPSLDRRSGDQPVMRDTQNAYAPLTHNRQTQ